jgi:fructokinase
MNRHIASPAYVAIETGGTKIVCRVTDEAGRTLGEFIVPTGEPLDAMAALEQGVRQILADAQSVAGVGVASFGPVDLNPASETYGFILETPKPGWSGFDLVADLSRRFGAPVAIDTDVNAAALAEQQVANGQTAGSLGVSSLAYLTVGTGIGAGLAIEGQTLRGALHPEVGHVTLRRAANDRQPSHCPFHPDCAEGLAAGPALGLRLAGRALVDAPEVAALMADYLGQVCATLVLVWSPQRIVLGGGVMKSPGLMPRIAEQMRLHLNGYGAARVAMGEDYLTAPRLEHSGLEGAVLLARRPAPGLA